jgi:aspartate aminotransferase
MTAPHIAAALQRIAPSQTTVMTDRAAALRDAGADIISLSVGEPDFPPPAHVIAAAHDALDAGQTRYTPVAGTAALRAAVARHFRRDLGLDGTDGAVMVTSGGKQAIFDALLATLDPGDEVVIPAPWWVSYPEIVRFAGGTVVPLRTNGKDGFRFGADDLARCITPATRWLILNTPGNPTGAVYPRAMLEEIGTVLRDHPHIMVLADDIYAPLVFDGARHVSFAAACPDLADRVLTISGVSKSHAMTGFRIGFAHGPDWLIAAMGRLQSHNSGNAASISQAAALAALEGSQDFLDDWRTAFARRRDLVMRAIARIDGLSAPVPEGAFYAFVDAGPLMQRFGDDGALVLHLLEAGVALVPASAFGGDPGFRISFAADDARLDEAMRRIAQALS